MTEQVARADTKHRWHPSYETVREWLDNEAPIDLPTPVDTASKARNRPKIRRVRKA